MSLLIDSISVSYAQKLILEEITVEFEKGKVYGILGRNGAGKTTFFNTIFGRVKANFGRIIFENQPLKKEKISFLETESYFYPLMKGIEYLELINSDKSEIEAFNKIFQLPLDKYIEDYSTGMKKKIAVIGTILQKRPILILDEPFNGLDLESNEILYKVIEKIKHQKIILLSSHILESLTNVCDEIHYLNQKHIEIKYMKNDFEELKNRIKKEIHQDLEESLKGIS
jgi:ABC-2 type transport system ATP-binding protein